MENNMEVETNEGGGSSSPKELAGMLDKGSFDSAFSSQEIVSALKMLYDPGKDDEITKLMMRSDVPDLQFLFTFSYTMSKCMRFKNKNGLQMLQIVLAGLPAVNHEKEYTNRTSQVVRAIIGTATGEDKGTGFMSKFKKAAGIGNEH